MDYIDNKETSKKIADGVIPSAEQQVEKLISKLAEREQSLRNATRELEVLKDRIAQRDQQAHVFIEKMLNGFTYNQVILDENEQVVDFRMLEVNESFLKSTKLKREEIIGVPVTHYIPEVKTMEPNLIQLCEAVALNGRSFVGEAFFETYGKWFEISAYSTRRGYFNVVYKDVSRRKKAEESASESRAYLEYSLNSAPDGVLLLDQEMRFSYTNPAFLNIFGISKDDIVGKSILDLAPGLITKTKANRIHKGAIHLLESGEPVSGAEVDLRSSDGGQIPSSFSAAGIRDEHDQFIGVVVFVKDISERKRTHELMIQTEKMMSVGGLAAGMAHEINNPLGGMLQGAQNIIRRLSPDLEANWKDARDTDVDLIKLDNYIKQRKIDEMLDGIISSGKRAARIITNMLQFSRQSESKFCPNDINELIDSVLELAANDYDLSKKHDFRKIEIVKEYGANLPEVPCTRTEIEQVILNLLKNAAQAMTPGPDDPLPKITIRTFVSDDFMQIEVEDNGPGFGVSVKNKVFEPFFTTKPVGQGTGLGLSVSYMIVTAKHKGIMEVDSFPGEGACFVIKLPLIKTKFP